MKKLLVVLFIFFAVGCAKKYTTPVTEPEKPLEEEEVISEEVQVEETLPPREIEEPVVTAKAEQPFEFKDVLFDFDKYDIRPDALPVLNSVADWLNRNKHIKILIEGHCDERGTNEYNLALGEKRARAVRNFLLAKGVAHVRMQIISYGEEKPICMEKNEYCWQKNRRAHFVIMK
jgi:peptidoglycan-associated lipoprotein